MRLLIFFILSMIAMTTGYAAPTAAQNLSSIAFYYGDDTPTDLLKAFDLVVVEPSSQFDPKQYNIGNSQALAYISIGEVKTNTNTYKLINKSWVIGNNPEWQSAIMDMRNPAWRKFIIEKEIEPLWQQGYRGFFLDTLDSYELVEKDPKQQAAMLDGEAQLIQQIKAQYPDAKIILNRGFKLIPKLHALITAVAAESLYYQWDARTHTYTTVPTLDRDWLIQQLHQVKNEGVPVIVIDYLAPKDRELARRDAAQIQALGFIPYVTNSDLTELGIGSIEVMPRTILMLYQNRSVYNAEAFLFGTMPLNYFGYKAEYASLDKPLPEGVLTGKYAGIVIWPTSNVLDNWQPYYKWALDQIHNGVPVAFLGSLGFPLTSQTLEPLGLNSFMQPSGITQLSITYQSPLMGYESNLLLEPYSQQAIRLITGTSLLQISNAQGQIADMAAFTPWGGYVLNPFVILSLPNNNTRWTINPLAFLKQALHLPDMPIPDPTTESGRRLMMIHVDGDAFISRAEWDPTLIAGEAMYKDIFLRFRVPTTVSVIVGEIAPFGVDPKLSPIAIAAARQIFRLPWIEIASHTFSHPFKWQAAETTNEGENFTLKIPNYTFNLKMEITGSIDYINQVLAPPGKRCMVLLWSGDATPDEAALAMTYQDHVANMNRGDTVITAADNSLTEIAPLGIKIGPYYQVFAPNQNENVYTNDWQGPYYGFEQVIQTFELTNKPYRFKPIDMYFHFYSATKLASINALKTVYTWALAQPVMNIYVSDYFKKVLDFNSVLIAHSGEGWLINNTGDLRELRVPQSMGRPDLSKSQNVVGYSPYGTDYYIHLGLATQSRLYFEKMPLPNPTQPFNVLLNVPCLPELRPVMGELVKLCNTPGQQPPYLLDANARVAAFTKTTQGFDFALQGYMPLNFSLAQMQRCELWQGKTILIGSYISPGVDHFTLPTTSTSTLQVKCQQTE